ncbi:hypothetical protein PENPOL_c007G00624 [Penicillium polonicum]|uniref:Uncharacterized protein n=1 Tax=Penicillium polonicum TaxID=60169 RepID=A0A1V6NIV3_PENPO|nr:hypothetical protein PENPOL_c007G00624 [Penicillium polonicum]
MKIILGLFLFLFAFYGAFAETSLSIYETAAATLQTRVEPGSTSVARGLAVLEVFLQESRIEEICKLAEMTSLGDYVP